MKRLVLAGGGHAHVHVLKRLAAAPLADTEITLISPYRRQIYSGMLPGWIAGHYKLAQCAIDIEALARRARIRFVRASLTSLDAEKQCVRTAGMGEIAYDVLSLDTGAETVLSMLAATKTELCPVRPLEHFVLAWERLLATAMQKGSVQLLVAGGGAAGVEIALACRHRLSQLLGKVNNNVGLVSGGPLLPGHGERISSRVRMCLEKHGIALYQDLAAGEGHGVRLAGGAWLAAELVIAATGVCPPPWLAQSGLSIAADGFIAVGSAQQSVSHDSIFAAGDVATRVDAPHPKSGVYAVRAGPVLDRNLRRRLGNEALLPYAPQKRSLYLLATGEKSAIMSWAGLSISGSWIWRWKDYIDRRFVDRYRRRCNRHYGCLPIQRWLHCRYVQPRLVQTLQLPLPCHPDWNRHDWPRSRCRSIRPCGRLPYAPTNNTRRCSAVPGRARFARASADQGCRHSQCHGGREMP
jgi:pyridine nucleotide-disulfide oxidoreductase family protein